MNLSLIDKKLVHKNMNQNVLIYEVRKMLPRRITRDLFEEVIVKNVSAVEKDYLLQFYVPSGVGGEKSDYILRTSTLAVKKNIDRFLNSGNLTTEAETYLLQLANTSDYGNAEAAGCFLAETASEMVETKVLNILGLRDYHIHDEQRMMIYRILQKFEELNWCENIFYSRMHIDTKHPFFFEHPNEHLPGMMLMEAIRQFGVACSHIFLKVPCEGVQFVLSDLRISFQSYLELSFPVKFEGRLTCTKYNRSGWLTYSDFVTEVFQNNQTVAVANIIGKNLPNELFAILRRSQIPRECSRFVPRTAMPVTVVFKDRNSAGPLELDNISFGGFCVKSPRSLPRVAIAELRLITPMEQIVFQGEALEFVSEREVQGQIDTQFKIIHLQEADRHKLERIFKLCCCVDEAMEII